MEEITTQTTLMLPDDVVCRVFSCSSTKTKLATCPLVCKAWAAALRSPSAAWSVMDLRQVQKKAHWAFKHVDERSPAATFSVEQWASKRTNSIQTLLYPHITAFPCPRPICALLCHNTASLHKMDVLGSCIRVEQMPWAALGSCRSLTYLRFSMQGMDTSEISTYSSSNSNPLQDANTALNKMTQLKDLAISAWQVVVPNDLSFEGLANLTSLQLMLDVEHEIALPACMTNLRRLRISGSYSGSVFPTVTTSCPGLTELRVSDWKATDVLQLYHTAANVANAAESATETAQERAAKVQRFGPSRVMHANVLDHIDLGMQLAALTRLQVLEIGGVGEDPSYHLGGHGGPLGLETLSQFCSLRHLRLQQCGLNALPQLPRGLEKLDLARNVLTILPAALSGLSGLRELMLEDQMTSSFSYSIPLSVASLPNIRINLSPTVQTFHRGNRPRLVVRLTAPDGDTVAHLVLTRRPQIIQTEVVGLMQGPNVQNAGVEGVDETGMHGGATDGPSQESTLLQPIAYGDWIAGATVNSESAAEAAPSRAPETLFWGPFMPASALMEDPDIASPSHPVAKSIVSGYGMFAAWPPRVLSTRQLGMRQEKHYELSRMARQRGWRLSVMLDGHVAMSAGVLCHGDDVAVVLQRAICALNILF